MRSLTAKQGLPNGKRGGVMKNFTRIENDILEALIKSNLSSAELRIAICILRKLNGFNKDSDMISLSQFMEYTGLSNRGVINAQRQLILMNICSLVEKGKSKKASNRWAFNKNVSTWQLVKRCSLVKFPTSTSELLSNQLVNLSSHTKESITKETIQKKANNAKQTKDNLSESNKFNLFIQYFNTLTGCSYKGCKKARQQFIARLREGYTGSDFKQALKNASKNKYLMGNNDSGRIYLTPEYITREDKIEQWKNATKKSNLI